MEEDKFKKLIQIIGLDEPGSSFTDNVMKTIESQEDLSLNPALLAVLRNEFLGEPSSDFSDNLMANIQTEVNKRSAPIITKQIRLVILGIGILILFLVLINSSSKFNHHNNFYFSYLNSHLLNTSTEIVKLSNSILLYVIPLSILLLMDYVYKSRQSHF